MIDYNGPKSHCTCKHLGDGPNSDHLGVKPVAGHGACTVLDCPCKRFTWKAFTDAFAAKLAESK